MSFLFLSLSIALASSMFIMNSPLMLGLWVIMAALSMALFISSFASWLGLMMFLIYVGGLLVMFAYFVALTPNIILGGLALTSLTAMNTFTILILLLISSPTLLQTLSILPQAPMKTLLMENMGATLSLALILFFALVAVVKICSQTSAPLRPFH